MAKLANATPARERSFKKREITPDSRYYNFHFLNVCNSKIRFAASATSSSAASFETEPQAYYGFNYVFNLKHTTKCFWNTTCNMKAFTFKFWLIFLFCFEYSNAIIQQSRIRAAQKMCWQTLPANSTTARVVVGTFVIQQSSYDFLQIICLNQSFWARHSQINPSKIWYRKLWMSQPHRKLKQNLKFES